jgi:hypothetical protein
MKTSKKIMWQDVVKPELSAEFSKFYIHRHICLMEQGRKLALKRPNGELTQEDKDELESYVNSVLKDKYGELAPVLFEELDKYREYMKSWNDRLAS